MEKQKKIKKKKLFIGLGAVSTIIIIPIVAVACGSEQGETVKSTSSGSTGTTTSGTTSSSGGSTSGSTSGNTGNETPSKPSVSQKATNQKIVDDIASNINNISLLANSTQTKLTPIEVAESLKSQNITLDTLNSYINTEYISSVLTNKNLTTNYTISNIDPDNGTLSINIQIILGSSNDQASTNAVINIDGFKSTTISNISANFKILNGVATSLEALKLTVSSNVKNKNPLDTESTLNTKTNILLTDLSNYFDTSSIDAIITKTPGLNVTYNVGQVLLNTGIINIIISLSIGSGVEQANINVILPISGFLTSDEIQATKDQITNQNSMNSLITQLNALIINTTNANIGPQAVEFELNKINPLSLSNFGTYFNTESIKLILDTVPTAVVTYGLIVNDSNITNGTITISLHISLGSNAQLVEGSTNLIISGFLSPNSIIKNINQLAIKKLIKPNGNSWIAEVNATNLQSYINGLPTLTNNFTYEFSITNTDTATGTLTFTVTVIDKNDTNIKSISNPIQLIGFVTPAQAAEVDKLANQIVKSTIVSKDNSTIVASSVNSSTLLKYVNNSTLPVLPKEFIYTYTILSSNNENGTLTIEIQVYNTSTASTDLVVSHSGPRITLTGFKKVF